MKGSYQLASDKDGQRLNDAMLLHCGNEFWRWRLQTVSVASTSSISHVIATSALFDRNMIDHVGAAQIGNGGSPSDEKLNDVSTSATLWVMTTFGSAASSLAGEL